MADLAHFHWRSGRGLTFPLLNARMTTLAPTRNRAIVMAMNGTVLRLSQSLSPLFFGDRLVIYRMARAVCDGDRRGAGHRCARMARLSGFFREGVNTASIFSCMKKRMQFFFEQYKNAAHTRHTFPLTSGIL